MKTITLDWLEKRHACPEARMTFLKRFGKRASVKDVVDTLHKLHRDDWEAWLLSQDYRLTFSMLECGADVHADYDEALCSAVLCGHFKIVQLLLEHGADVHVSKDHPIYLTAQKGYLKITQLLIEHGADVHVDNDEALRLAVECNHPRVAHLLRKKSQTV